MLAAAASPTAEKSSDVAAAYTDIRVPLAAAAVLKCNGGRSAGKPPTEGKGRSGASEACNRLHLGRRNAKKGREKLCLAKLSVTVEHTYPRYASAVILHSK